MPCHGMSEPLPMDQRISVVMFHCKGSTIVTVPRNQEERKLAFAQIRACEEKYPYSTSSIIYADSFKIAHTNGQEKTSAIFFPPSDMHGLCKKVTTEIEGMDGALSIEWWRNDSFAMQVLPTLNEANARAFLAASQICHHPISYMFFMTVEDKEGQPFSMTMEEADEQLMLWTSYIFSKPIMCQVCLTKIAELKANGKELKHCALCKIRKYCSKECQTQEWPEHKRMCTMYQKFSDIHRQFKDWRKESKHQAGGKVDGR